MSSVESVKSAVRVAFQSVEYPGDTRLTESQQGEEPRLLEVEFRGKDDWTKLPPTFLDQAPAGYGSALSFFSREALRFYLPGYLIADLDRALVQTDPVFYLTNGFVDERRNVPVNPRLYGDLTWEDRARDRFAVFGATECSAIVAYLEEMSSRSNAHEIAQALKRYWYRRARGR